MTMRPVSAVSRSGTVKQMNGMTDGCARTPRGRLLIRSSFEGRCGVRVADGVSTFFRSSHLGHEYSVLLLAAPEDSDAAPRREDLPPCDALQVSAALPPRAGDDVIVIRRRHTDALCAHARVRDLDALPDVVRGLLGERAVANDVAPAQLRELLVDLPGAVFRCELDARGRVLYMNPQIGALCGHARRRFAGRDSRRLLALVHPADRRRLCKALDEARCDGEAF